MLGVGILEFLPHLFIFCQFAYEYFWPNFLFSDTGNNCHTGDNAILCTFIQTYVPQHSVGFTQGKYALTVSILQLFVV